jgi:hypothetical protein
LTVAEKPVPSRYLTVVGQLHAFVPGAAGMDWPLEEDPDWKNYAATRKYSFANLTEAFELGKSLWHAALSKPRSSFSIGLTRRCCTGTA